MNTEAVYHIPALLPQTLDALSIELSGIYVDCTFGGGGHSRAILGQLGPEGRLYAFDQDEEALENVPDDSRLTAIHGNFGFLNQYLRFYGVKGRVNGILADLGVSFHHFDDPERGFSFRFDGPLDMRMNRRGAVSAADVVNNDSEERLSDIFHLYGELKQARRLASAIVKARQRAPIQTVEQLLAVVKPLISPKAEKKELAQLFQALRIEVNGEIRALEQLLERALDSLAPGGRLVIITYHSLEDRLVKNFMRTGRIDGREQKDFYGRNLSPLKLLTSKPIVADEEEVERNPRSRSAKLRVARKL
ncbi:MAG: 16S rRNA (cytosine(1402)-N(4))-methyltransferase RsmH [Bacteroides sp.]|nr:16S rRNA (cytosine(1402)-N(4))-methyltransferase RsmH [Bacteroides sp.]MCM1379206.1 16S rRNA (cytosine(1402)-N(4))-methyltransferase RsmH [Bacteroides sp.]MCM1445145.1 16S rRNA (cytosine(1402)-N(4))-methyltransferase RsmH [Prevotella sp.]